MGLKDGCKIFTTTLNRNTLTQVNKLKKFQSQLSDDFAKQFSVLEKLLESFCSDTKRKITEDRKELDTKCKETGSHTKCNISLEFRSHLSLLENDSHGQNGLVVRAVKKANLLFDSLKAFRLEIFERL